MENLLKPPSYCPDALATDVGWINPKNGEVLVLVKNLRKKIADSKTEVLTSVDEPVTITETVPVVEAQVTEEAPVKRGRGRPRKTSK